MSSRDPVRELAEEMADALVECSCNPEERWVLESRDDYKGRAVDEWEARLRSLLEERESHWRRLAETPNAALTAALAEAAGLRGALEEAHKQGGEDDCSAPPGVVCPECSCGLAECRTFFDRPPLARAAAEVLEAAEEEHESLEWGVLGSLTEAEADELKQRTIRRFRAVKEYRALLRGEGEEGNDEA